MSDFEERKRDWFLTEACYKEKLDFYPRFMADPVANAAINDQNEDDQYRRRLSWTRCFKTLEWVILRYSAGEPIPDLIEPARGMFDQFARHKRLFPQWNMLFWEPDAYQYTMWLLGLAVLFNMPEQVPQIRTWLAPMDNGKEEPLLGQLFSRFGVKTGPAMPDLIYPKPYQHLYDALTAPDKTQATTALTAYLKNWYRGMKDCYWYDRHKNTRHAVHFGYWSFEAGMATLLLGLDDSSYREMQFYPKDLVDYAKTHGAGLPAAPRAILVKTGEPAPHSGLYAAYEGLAREVIVKQGDLLPEAEDLMDPNRPKRAFVWILRQRDDGGSVTR